MKKVEIKISAQFEDDGTTQVGVVIERNNLLKDVLSSIEMANKQIIQAASKKYAKDGGNGDFEDFDKFLQEARIGDFE